jgi:tight adherence protein B
MPPNLVPLAVGGGVLTLFLAIGLALSGSKRSEAEERLEALSGGAAARRRKGKDRPTSILRPGRSELASGGGWLDQVLSLEGLGRLYEQADVGLPGSTFALVAVALGVAGAVLAFALRLPPLSMPIVGLTFAALPPLWLVMRRGKRIKTFMTQMPDAMELVGRALRAGHGLASGLHVVADEMPAPISQEFGRVYEEQNLGIPLEDALRGLADRMPTMDVRFFVTAVVIQRATGGDLAEVLDKIGRLIRERFQILGQVKALTGEGRISGAVLLAMPPAIMAFVYMTNPDYISLLFTTDIGKKMLIGTAFLQLVGALAIKKIVTIKV